MTETIHRLLRTASLLLVVALVLGQGYRAFTFQRADLPEGRSAQLRSLDYRWIYFAGKCWVEGVSPHNYENFKRVWQKDMGYIPDMPMAYPPTLAVLSVPIALFPWDIAFRIYDTLNLLALVFSLYFLHKILGQFAVEETRRWIALSVAATMGSITGVLYTGQTTLFVLCGITAAIYYVMNGRLWSAASWIILATVKPHLGLLPMAILLLYRPALLWRGMVTCGLVSAMTVAYTWESGLVASFFESLRLHTQTPFNQMEYLSITEQLLAKHDLRWLRPFSSIVALAACWSVWTRFGRLTAFVLTVPFLATVVFMPLHSYDSVVLMVPLALIAGTGLFSWTSLPLLIILSRPRAAMNLLGMPLTEQLELGFVGATAVVTWVWMEWRLRRTNTRVYEKPASD